MNSAVPGAEEPSSPDHPEARTRLEQHVRLVEVLGGYSKIAWKTDRLRKLLEIQSSAPAPVRRRTKQVQRRLSEADTSRLAAQYRAGQTQRVLAKRFGVHRTTVTSLLVRAGVNLRQRGLTEDEIAEAAALYEAGWSLLRVGERFGVDARTVSDTFRRHGLPVRARKGWPEHQ
ncbi:MAG: hypothetical protein M3441_25125 [Chloroflexota bacterium]|nr:hypothetical protein [Chloroflexota bacterium]